jgi:ligand-binding sensor domain-containing protein/signal transduction histidine kinase
MHSPLRRITGLLILLFGVAIGALHAQSVITNYRHYRMSDGLPADKVTCLYEAPDGHLWVGTNGGLCRFDGTTFTTLPTDPRSVPVQTVTALHSPNDTLLYIGTWRGLAVFNLYTGRFENSRIRDVELRAGSGQAISDIAPLPGGGLLVVAGEYLALLDRNGNTRIIRRAVEDLNTSVSISRPPPFLDADSSRMLVLMHNSGLYELDLSSLALTPADGRYGERRLEGEGVEELAFAYRLPGGMRFLFGTYWGSRYVYSDRANGDRILFIQEPDQPGGVPAYPSRLVQDPVDPSVYWVASHFGLRRFSDKDLSFDTYVVSGANGDFVTRNTFQDLVIDRHGQKWLASNSGLIKLSKLTWLFQDLGFNGLPRYRDVDFGKAIVDDSGRLWVASFDRGIYQVEFGKEPLPMPRWRMDPSNGANITFDLQRIDGVTYVATNRGILRYNDSEARFEGTGWVPDSLLIEATATCIHRDHGGEWWIGVGRGGGLVRIGTNGQRTVYNHYHREPGTPEFLPIRYPTIIAEDSTGDLWMGMPRQEGMLIRWRRATERFDTVRVELDGVHLLRVAITDLRFGAEQDLWVTTYSHGVLRRDARTGAWRQYDVSDGLRSNDVAASVFDRNGNLWVSTQNGIAVLKQGTDRFQSFTVEDGMPHAQAAWLGFPYSDLPDRMVLTGIGYAHSVDVGALLLPRGVLRVVIERIQVEGESHMVQEGGSFPHDRSQFEFFFSTVNLVDGPDNRYMYTLEGLDDRWIDAGGRRSANYANVPPGRYVFRVKVGNASIGWSEPASISFVVVAPFWQRWWFFAAVLLLCSAILYAIYRVRVDRLLEMERVRSHISRDLHDDIGSTLSSINILAHTTRSRLGKADPRKLEESLEKIGERTQRMLDNMTDIVWSIKPENDALPSVLARMREHASSTLEAKEIDYTIDFPEYGANLQLALELKNNLYLVFKEAVNNLAKYSGATKATIALTVKDRTLRMVVQDNGKGFDPAMQRRGNGLYNMQRRAKESGARLIVESSPGNGTRVEFMVLRIP